MNFFLAKIKYKLKLLVTNPRKFFGVLWSMAKKPFIRTKATGPGRGTSDAESAALQKYAGQAKQGIVEIGVLFGLTMKEIAEAAHVPCYGIDPIITDSMSNDLVGSEEEIRKNLSFYRDFHFIKDYSYNVAKNWQYPFDFIFIDGDHTYEAVRKDFEDWLPLLAKGGVMAFHDSAPLASNPDAFFLGWPGPTRLVGEIKSRDDLEFLGNVDTLSFFRKL